MCLLLVLTAVAICFNVSEQNETKRRIASLVVLPPLVLGYDELYYDSTEAARKYAPNKRMTEEPLEKEQTLIRPSVAEIDELPQIEEPAEQPTIIMEPAINSLKTKQPAVALITKKEPTAASALKKRPVPVPNKQPAEIPVPKKQPTAAPILKKQPAKTPVPKKQPTAAPILKKQPAAAPVSKKQPAVIAVKKSQKTKNISRRKAQRSIIIDTKGRRNFRRNYRSSYKRRKKDKRRDSGILGDIDDFNTDADGNTALDQVPISGGARWSNTHGGIITWRQN